MYSQAVKMNWSLRAYSGLRAAPRATLILLFVLESRAQTDTRLDIHTQSL